MREASVPAPITATPRSRKETLLARRPSAYDNPMQSSPTKCHNTRHHTAKHGATGVRSAATSEAQNKFKTNRKAAQKSEERDNKKELQPPNALQKIRGRKRQCSELTAPLAQRFTDRL
jgi:hypothetical protein